MFSIVVALVLFFFFSSRRRHTRCGRDWSSDVCSSDLGPHSTRRPACRTEVQRLPSGPVPAPWLGPRSPPHGSLERAEPRLYHTGSAPHQSKTTATNQWIQPLTARSCRRSQEASTLPRRGEEG